MTTGEPLSHSEQRTPNALQIALLAVGAGAGACSVLIGMAALVAAADQPGGVGLRNLASFGGYVALGAVVAVAAWWAYYVVGQIRSARRLVEAFAFGLGRNAEAPVRAIPLGPGDEEFDGAAPLTAQQGHRICAALEELSATLLMSPAERRAVREKLEHQKVEGLRAAGEAALRRGDFRAAEAAWKALSDHGVEPATAESFHERIAADRKAVESEALRWTTDHCHDLMALANYAAAEEAAGRLVEACPKSTGAAELLAHVQRERQAYTNEQSTAMFREIERYAADRQWRKAVAAAKALQKRHGQTPEARTVAEKMPTLLENARIEEVRELRDRIASRIAAKQYGQAVRLAAEVLERFPDTAAAKALRGHIDRMKQLAVDTGRTGWG